MIGDHFVKLSPAYLRLAENVLSKIPLLNQKNVISICGESGCGKTTLARSIQEVQKSQGADVAIIHMDDYFFLPPKSNHENRLKDINNVGMHEVNLDLLSRHIGLFKSGEAVFNKPLVDYQNNIILEEEFSSSSVDMLIIEGTYTGMLDGLDGIVFFEHSYLDTMDYRQERARDIMNDFNERVLAIEHDIIQRQKERADLVIAVDYNLS